MFINKIITIFTKIVSPTPCPQNVVQRLEHSPAS
jgi:hypothetical protein